MCHLHAVFHAQTPTFLFLVWARTERLVCELGRPEFKLALGLTTQMHCSHWLDQCSQVYTWLGYGEGT